MSVRAVVVVSVGGVPPAHLVVGHVTILFPPLPCVRNRVIVWPAIAPEYVTVGLLFSVILKMVPNDQSTVGSLVVATVSTKALIVSVPEITTSPLTSSAVRGLVVPMPTLPAETTNPDDIVTPGTEASCAVKAAVDVKVFAPVKVWEELVLEYPAAA